MSPSEAVRALAALIPARRPAYLWGPPGVGKSSVVLQAAESLDLDLVDLRATHLDPVALRAPHWDPVDLRGLPGFAGDVAVWGPPAFLPRGGGGVLFLDELAQAPPLVQSACLQLVLDRRVGEYALPDGWAVVAAG